MAVRAVVVILCAAAVPSYARQDGLARTPPMGWSSWYAYGADFNETSVLEAADALVRTGLRDAGYEYVNLDDGWMAPMRDRFGRLQGDPDRFPHGMKWLANEIHSRGLKFGLYGCVGVRTCLGFPGQFEHEYDDARLLAEWGIDFWKHDNCWQEWATVDLYAPELTNSTIPGGRAYLEGLSYGLNIRGLSTDGEDAHPIYFRNLSGLPSAMPDPHPWVFASARRKQIQQYEAYRLFGEALESTGRKILYNPTPLISGCDASVWEYYRDYAHMVMNQCPQIDNTDRWDSLTTHLDDNNAYPGRADAAGPGYWNDMDMLMVGFKALKAWQPRQGVEEYRSQISLFAVLAAPLIFSADIRGTTALNLPTVDGTNATAPITSVLANREVLRVSQDPLGRQGWLTAALGSNKTLEVYMRPLADGAAAVAVLNRGAAGAELSVSWPDAGLPKGYKVASVRDLWAGAEKEHSNTGVSLSVCSHCTRLLRVVPVA